jgi:sulfur carrier protein ThiS
MMTATIRPIGSLKKYLNGESQAQVVAGQPVRQAIASLGIPPEIIALVLVNDVQQDKNYILQDGDEAKILAVIGGG